MLKVSKKKDTETIFPLADGIRVVGFASMTWSDDSLAKDYDKLIFNLETICIRYDEGSLVGVTFPKYNIIFFFRTPFLYFIGYQNLADKPRAEGFVGTAKTVWFDYYTPSYPDKVVDLKTLLSAFKDFSHSGKSKSLNKDASIIHAFITGAVRLKNLFIQFERVLAGKKEGVSLSNWKPVYQEYHSLLKSAKMANSLLQTNSTFRSIDLTKMDAKIMEAGFQKLLKIESLKPQKL